MEHSLGTIGLLNLAKMHGQVSRRSGRFANRPDPIRRLDQQRRNDFCQGGAQLSKKSCLETTVDQQIRSLVR